MFLTRSNKDQIVHFWQLPYFLCRSCNKSFPLPLIKTSSVNRFAVLRRTGRFEEVSKNALEPTFPFPHGRQEGRPGRILGGAGYVYTYCKKIIDLK
jgi:hypothetical protein